MCDTKASSTPAAGGGIDIEVICTNSGKPITISNEYGMFCEDMCDYPDAKNLHKDLKAVLAPLDDDSLDDDEKFKQMMQNLFNFKPGNEND